MDLTARPPAGHGADAEMLAGLWQHAPFPRLPLDAPAELRELVADVENPRRVYAIHRASRRHNFQLTVQKYIVQLCEGCGASECHNPTCFTCRKRIAGQAPLRRYNATSARTLAVHLASQENPEVGLCASLRLPKTAPAAVRSLRFTPKYPPMTRGDGVSSSSKTTLARAGSPKDRKSATKHGHAVYAGSKDGGTQSEKSTRSKADTASEGLQEAPKFIIVDKPASKDYRSFAANMFGTVAFKMLEWLTPAAIENMTEKAEKLQAGFPASDEGKIRAQEERPRHDATAKEAKDMTGSESVDATGRHDSGAAELAGLDSRATSNGKSRQTTSPTNTRRNSNARLRTQSTKPQRKLSVDAFPPESSNDELLPNLRSPLIPSIQTDGMNHRTPPTKSLKTPTPAIPRPISQLSGAAYFEGVPLEKMPPIMTAEIRPQVGRNQADGSQGSGSESSLEQLGSRSSRSPSSDRSDANQSSVLLDADLLDTTFDTFLPQTLTRLDTETIDFVCDVLQDDHTAEQHLLEPATVAKFHTRVSGQPRPLRRKEKSLVHGQSVRLREGEEWRLFAEQSFFYVLSDPHTLLSSFTKHGQLYDTQTLWYCMLRMTRVAPSLVFHSLWVAAEMLFAPPQALQALCSPTVRLFPQARKFLTNAEAGMLVSICLHALVAAAPPVDSARKLYDMSRIRSQGLSLAVSNSIARQPAELCLQYDDAFSNPLALRLARRLLTAITTRRIFDELMEYDVGRNSSSELDVLDHLFAQLDFLNMDAAYILDFTVADRTLHETRMPTLLLDWARAVMLHDWDGRPDVSGDSPFGGALALIKAIFERRQALLVGDAQFRSEFFAERLDEVETPLSWLTFNSTKQRLHILDFPYIFSPDTLVSYFRAINFSRMSRSFEESSSLQNRMDAIVSPSSLVINPHHKSILQGLLQTASAKYLILDIGRTSVLQDAFDQLWRREERELLRPLKIHLGEEGGEEGLDSGGVQQEFFRMAIAEALDPAYGAFTVDSRTRMAWFSPTTLEEEWKFELVGILVSLALYNGVSLPVTFPKALYRKLLGEPVTELHHISDGWPDLANGLTALLEWNEQDGAVEDIFVRTYEFSVDMFGQPISRVMDASGSWPKIRENVTGTRARSKKNKEASDSGYGPTASTLLEANPGDEAPMVTNANRNAYVTDYIHYLTDVSVRRQFEGFSRGFRACLHAKSLRLLTPALLQSMVEGEQEIDVSELRRQARYVGWDASHRTVRDFWSVVSRYDDVMKRKLLEFVTASDRVPVGGIKNLHFVIQRNGEESGTGGHLPTAYTCYGILLLPVYRDRAVLQERLAMALENAQGFGFA
ncbi:hect domain containing protein [Grosmannia clavigera kw1407]|uniref:HECT-type E3 ubiquitin transferase n=1 Tax=Grosmannia clavigera (strain kw1407 / UAMH 11150) TaxID=655863 RepID=F0XLV2_GROCL|nr:hect domain containing protein [Grosmannia clavigera kw1407]EFX01251.1 hect domain containing protein [Grosmannia clavigera kw1407]